MLSSVVPDTPVTFPESEWLSEALISEVIEETVGQLATPVPARIIDRESVVLPLASAGADQIVGVSSGFVHRGTIHPVREGLAARAAVVRTLWHELPHYGLRRFMARDQYIARLSELYGRDGWTKTRADEWIDTFLRTTYNQNPEIEGIRYDFASRQFVENGKPVTRDRFNELAQTFRDRAGSPGHGSIRRAGLLQSLVRSESGARPGLLEDVFRRGAEHVSRGIAAHRPEGSGQEAPNLRGVFSRNQASARGLSVSAIENALRPILDRWQFRSECQRPAVD